jgi:hypothetical protein
MGKFIDLTGQHFGRWTVIRNSGDKSKSGDILWECRCDCGNNKLVGGAFLRGGKSKSCGCLNRDLSCQRSKRHNEYNLLGDYGVGVTSQGKQFKFDLDDFDRIKEYCWTYGKNGYLFTYKHGKALFLHRLIMQVSLFGVYVDHINHDTLDNRKINLRMCTNAQNSFNKNVKGYCWDKNRNKWKVAIKAYGKRIMIGRFDTEEEAVKARKEAEKKYFGEFSFDSSIGISEYG